jgi:hypothetical protein
LPRFEVAAELAAPADEEPDTNMHRAPTAPLRKSADRRVIHGGDWLGQEGGRPTTLGLAKSTFLIEDTEEKRETQRM